MLFRCLEKSRVELNLAVFQLPGKMHLTHLSVACHRSHPAISPWICPSLKLLTVGQGWQLDGPRLPPLDIHFSSLDGCLVVKTFWKNRHSEKKTTFNELLPGTASCWIEAVTLKETCCNWIPSPESKLIQLHPLNLQLSTLKKLTNPGPIPLKRRLSLQGAQHDQTRSLWPRRLCTSTSTTGVSLVEDGKKQQH